MLSSTKGEHGRITAVKHQVPVLECSFHAGGFDVRIGQAHLDSRSLVGGAAAAEHSEETIEAKARWFQSLSVGELQPYDTVCHEQLSVMNESMG